eukprot:3742796-Lingulodinium_polyedra.AAC.1
MGCISETILSNSRARPAHKHAPKRRPLLRRRAFRNARAPRDDHHTVVDARRAHIARFATPQQ